MNAERISTPDTAAWKTLCEIALIFLVFFFHGAWPTPDHNETHYLSKAAHFWNHETFANDFFCNTADAHDVFYFAFGWLTRWLPLDAVAWVGRCITWLMLACAWQGLSRAVLPRAWISVLTAELFVLLTEHAQMAGEWIVGGVEAKGFAYAFVLWGLQAIVRARWNLAWLALGAATLLHAVVGGWAAICAAAVWIVSRSDRPALRTMLPGLAGGLLLALPGLWIGAALNWQVDGQTMQQANYIQVFERLPHHLLPTAYREGFVARHLLLWTLFGLLCSVTPATPTDRPLRRFVAAAMLLALAGFGLGCAAAVAPDFAAHWLRFYWLRLLDIIVPAGVSLLALRFVATLAATHRVRARWWLGALLTLSVYNLAIEAQHLPGLADRFQKSVPRPDDVTAHDDWLDACRWAAQNTPPGTRFITPWRSATFKWHAGRDEVVTWKDMPQDAVSVVSWWQRMNDVFGAGSDDPDKRWHTTLAEAGAEHLRRVAEKYQAQYAIVELLPDAPPLALQPVYQNKSYAVYHIE